RARGAWRRRRRAHGGREGAHDLDARRAGLRAGGGREEAAGLAGGPLAPRRCNLFGRSAIYADMRYAIVIEKGLMGFSAYVPDLPGCVAAAGTRDGVVRDIHSAIETHIEGLRNDGRPIPAPAFSVEFVDVASQPEAARPCSAVAVNQPALNGSGSSAPRG